MRRSILISLAAALMASEPGMMQGPSIRTVAGGGPHNVPATSVRLDPSFIGVDASGRLFVADARRKRVFKVDPAGNLTVAAGTGGIGPDAGDINGDGGPAVDALLQVIRGLVVTAPGDLFVNDVSFKGPRKNNYAKLGVSPTPSFGC